MTNEQRANWIRRGIILFVALVVVLGVWFFPEKKVEKKAATADAAKHLVEVLHFHQPGLAESETLADTLNKVGKKYGEQVLITRIDIAKDPARAKAEKVTQAPKVVMMAGEIRACKFQGLWTQAQIERKLDEILHGLKRMGKDWRPDVKGMQTAAEAPAPAPPLKAASPLQPGKPNFPPPPAPTKTFPPAGAATPQKPAQPAK